MLPTVFLLLSVFIVQVSACDDLKEGAVRNLQDSIKDEHKSGFLKVFPKNYVVKHHFNGSTQCEDSCCVFTGAVFLYHSWMQLLQNLEKIHLKYDLIVDLMTQLELIWREAFQETPDPSIFPSVHSSPTDLLTYTKDIFSKWLTLNCPVGDHACILPSLASQFKEDKEEEERQAETEKQIDQFHCGGERERVKRCITVIPTNRNDGLFASTVLILCTLLSLRMLLGMVLRELC